MTIYQRPDEKILAESSKQGELKDFPDISRGWGIVFDKTGGIPPMEWFNALGKRTDEAIRYLLQRGIAEWSKTEDYPVGAVVSYDKRIWLAEKNNKGIEPKMNTVWRESALTIDSANFIIEAPKDGERYVRCAGQWVKEEATQSNSENIVEHRSDKDEDLHVVFDIPLLKTLTSGRHIWQAKKGFCLYLYWQSEVSGTDESEWTCTKMRNDYPFILQVDKNSYFDSPEYWDEEEPSICVEGKMIPYLSSAEVYPIYFEISGCGNGTDIDLSERKQNISLWSQYCSGSGTDDIPNKGVDTQMDCDIQAIRRAQENYGSRIVGYNNCKMTIKVSDGRGNLIARKDGSSGYYSYCSSSDITSEYTLPYLHWSGVKLFRTEFPDYLVRLRCGEQARKTYDLDEKSNGNAKIGFTCDIVSLEENKYNRNPETWKSYDFKTESNELIQKVKNEDAVYLEQIMPGGMYFQFYAEVQSQFSANKFPFDGASVVAAPKTQ
ncbi:hypothetical protein [Pragia fontium]|uniref:hypothetical protein n=1 Tax=Pragia fontium TaxID=82985 RepID=UPI0006498B01|nr:hypothetical protein [Pragia fontium]AKJ42816.1 hypothetical protein QQ39_12610 [Pragia fontium]